MRQELSRWDGYISSALLGTEAIRACARYDTESATLAREWLEGVALLPVSDQVLDLAAYIEPLTLRSLDAIHLATALSVRDDVGVLFTYDERQADAAHRLGLDTAAPG